MPILKTIAIAILAAGMGLFLFGRVGGTGTSHHISALIIAACSAMTALFAAKLVSLGNAWRVLVVIATPAMVLVPIYQPPTWIFPVIFLVLAGFYINGVRERVPLYLSNTRTQKVITELIPPDANVTFVDLGCGLGDIVSAVSRARPQARIIGVETAPLSFLIAWLRIKLAGAGNAEIRFQDIWSTDTSNADVVYAFLSPAPMTRLNEKLTAEMKPGSRFISNSFAIPGAEPDEVVAVDDSRKTQLLIWRM